MTFGGFRHGLLEFPGEQRANNTRAWFDVLD
jgi:hypothetical protein